MHLLRIMLFCLAGLCAAAHAHAQGRKCVTRPAGDLAAFEKWMDQELEKRQGQRTSSQNVLTIPVVFHIIHNGQPAGTGYNLSAAQVYAQVDQLNDDFRRIAAGYNTDPRGADAYIEFCPALYDPSGNVLSEPGIDRIHRSSKGWTAPPYGSCGGGYFDPDYIENTIKPQSVWDTDDYLNIWVLYMDCGILGYAQFPEANGAVVAQLPDLNGYGGYGPTDGVVLNYYTLGSVCSPYPGSAPYNLGRTATHEVGHWLGLYHIWGDNYCGDDHCDDTPVHEDYNWGVPSHPKPNFCGSPDEMFENYMDYTDDEVMNIFSADQVNRMRVILENAPRRASLTTSGKCSAGSYGPVVSFVGSCSEPTASVDEGSGSCRNGVHATATFELRISRAPAANVQVRLGFSGTAAYGSDFIADTLITFAAGTDTNRTVTVSVIPDGLVESNEQLTMYILSVSGGGAQEDAMHQSVVVDINEDDYDPFPGIIIEQSSDTLSGYAEFVFGPHQTIHFLNPNTQALMLTLTNTSAHNFGCTRVDVTRSGNGASRAWTANASDYIASKTFRVLPEFNNTSNASYQVTLYYTESEIAGWESATGNDRDDLRIIKTSGNIAQVSPPTAPEYALAARNSLGSEAHQFTATYTTGFSSFGLGAFNGLLPVTWKRFDATGQDDHIALEWETASETPGTVFDIQRSSDPQIGFTTLASIVGQGSPQRDAQYRFHDHDVNAGTVYYYRIQNSDPDGRQTPTTIRTAKLAEWRATLRLFPSPFRESITLSGGPEGSARSLQIADLSGRIILQTELATGDQTIATGDIPPGIYIATVWENGRQVMSQKIVRAL